MQSIQEQFFIQQQEANYNLKHDLNQVSTNVGQIQNISDTFPQEPSNFNLNSVNIPNMLYVQSPPFTESEPTQAHHSSIEYLKKKSQILDVSILNRQQVLENTSLHIINKSSTYQTNQNVSTTTSTSTSSSGKSQVRVCINRLSIEDSRLMQQSIKKFVQKSPELARSMGLLQETCQQQHENLNIIPTSAEECVLESRASSTNNTVKIPIDTFSTIKADEKRSAKRKLAISIGDIPPEQICK